MKIADLEVPDPDLTDPAILASFYSGFAFYEHWRKVVLAQCEELVRAKFAAQDVKITETRIQSLARLHAGYLGFLETHLHGRISWEREVQKKGFGA